ncbi:MFS transporter [Sneathiella chungangensis]|uniref:MFS transporter n=1 Tax=Sneathiella chungangensis TaxID=1418234 RepID=A0A845MDT7_9PROT|nr:MFS transporter [Sneathiella chungangensis]MZR21802.1 MFS transporter [Sneathiella chungangensis]
MSSQFALLKKKRFLPLFVVQILGAFNDNIFKNAMIILFTYRAVDNSGVDGEILVTLAAGIFILPFFLFSALAGQIADKYEKSALVRIIKFAEIIIMMTGAIAFYIGDSWALMTVLFFMGVQSTFFGPLKYGILPEHLREEELVGGNALIDAATFLAILGGTIGGSLLILRDQGELFVTLVIIAVALSGWLASLKIPRAGVGDATISVSANIVKSSYQIINHSRKSRPVFLSVLAISWFWLIGAALLILLPIMVREAFNGDETVVTFLLCAFSIGIGIGSLMCNKLLKGEVSAKFAALSLLVMTGFLIDLSFAVPAFFSAKETINFSTFLVSGGARVFLDLGAISISAGIFVVPLYALIQEKGDKEHHARIIASLNIINSLAMVLSSLAIMALFAIHASFSTILLILAGFNLIAAFYVSSKVGDCTLKRLLASRSTERNHRS